MAGDAQRPAVILLHGSADSPGCWRDVMALLAAAGWRCIAPVVPAAWRPGVRFALDSDLPLIEGLIAATGHPGRVIGHSYGALAALRFTLQAPGSVSHLGLFEPISFGLLDDQPGGRGRMDELQERFVTPVEEGRPEIGLEWLVEYWNGAGAWARLAPEARDRLAAGAHRVVAEVSSGFADRTSGTEVARLAIPTLVLAGQHTTRESLAVCSQLAQHVPGARHLVVDGAGHQMTRSHPAVVAEAIEQLLTR